MRKVRESSVQPSAGTLGTWVGLLGSGSPCFCCGAPLETASTEATRDLSNPPQLICPRCGAAVFDETSAPMKTAAGRKRILAAA